MNSSWKAVSNIIAEAIIIAMVISWMGIIAHLSLGVNSKISTEKTPMFLPLACTTKAVVLKTVYPGYAYMPVDWIKIYKLLPKAESIPSGQKFYVEKNSVVLINTTGSFLPSKIILGSDDRFIVIDTRECTVYKQ